MNKKMVLYGTGFRGEKFYSANPDMQFEYCIDTKYAGKHFHDLMVFSFEEKKKEIKDYFVVVAVVQETIYQEIAYLLRDAGLKEFYGFLWDEYMYRRKIALLYGNCHVATICQHLKMNVQFTKNYKAILWDLSKKKSLQLPEWIYQNCELLIMQDIREENRYKAMSADELGKKVLNYCRKIVIPNIFGFTALFPQAQDYQYTSKYIKHNLIALDNLQEKAVSNNYNPMKDIISIMSQPDGHIDYLFLSGASLSEIVDSILFEDIYPYCQDEFHAKIEKIEKREKQCDIKIADFIKMHYKNHNLFHSAFHPTAMVLSEYVSSLLKILDIPEDSNTMKNFFPGEDNDERFIYGGVKRRLGITFEQKTIRNYNNHTTLWGRPLTLADYVRQHILWNWGKTIE
jgi:hypothetical protein